MKCPKCESDVENKASGFWLGFIGKAAFPKYVCPNCGKLDFSDFNEDTRKEIFIQRVICRILYFALLILIFIVSFKVATIFIPRFFWHP
jgi:transposase-like protein